MEKRNYTSLRDEIDRFYNQYDVDDLRNRVYRVNGEIEVQQQYAQSTTYCEGMDCEHTIEISIPGKKTFADRSGKLQDTIQSNDIKITVYQPNRQGIPLSHEQVIRDLYSKIDGNHDNYIWYRNLLSIVYSNNNLNQIEGIDSIYEVETYGYNIPTLISFFRWCGTQENINYPTGWGKDLSFSRYFEAIYAGYIQGDDLLDDICRRANTKGIPPLYGNVEIEEVDTDIYNACLNNRKRYGIINLCNHCGEYEALENDILCEQCEAMRLDYENSQESEAEECDKALAEEESGTKQYTQDEIEELYLTCLYDIKTSLEDGIEENFNGCNLKPIYNDIDNSFKGTMFRVAVNRKIIDAKVSYGYIGDEPSEESSINMILYIDNEEVDRRYIVFRNGEYEWNSEQSSYTPITDDKFKFKESDIEEFVNLVIENIETSLVV